MIKFATEFTKQGSGALRNYDVVAARQETLMKPAGNGGSR